MSPDPKRSTALISDLLSFCSLSQTEQLLKRIPLRGALDQALSNISTDIQEKNAVIKICKLPTVVGSEIQLTRLFQNLISNAIKFCNSECVPTIDIDAALRPDGMVEVRVKDNGIGVASKYQAQIFKMLKRLHSKDEYQGTGIGLASCQRIVEIHGGEIGIESSGNSGSTFWFTLQTS